MKATVDIQTPDGLELPQAVERELYYLTMEALNNTLKHTQATEVAVTIRSSPIQLQLEITDDGVGFDPTQTFGGYGLRDMRERAERFLGGRLEILRTRCWHADRSQGQSGLSVELDDLLIAEV